jgi:hypothetical protein
LAADFRCRHFFKQQHCFAVVADFLHGTCLAPFSGKNVGLDDAAAPFLCAWILEREKH